MRFAIPVSGGRLTTHFGHADAFTFIDVDAETKEITHVEEIPAPEHQPGLLPKWIHEMNTQVVIAGGMGQSAQDLMRANGIEVVLGAPDLDLKDLVRAYLNKTLVTGDNVCDH